MLKKILTTLSAAAVAFFFTLGISHAETVTSGKMYDAFNKKYADENYDYAKGTLNLQHVQTINLNKPITVKNGDKDVQVDKLQVGIAHFKTKRDMIFYKDWTEYAYYAPNAGDKGLVLSEADVANVNAIKAFKDKYSSDVSLEMTPIVILCLIIIVVPFIFGFIWRKYKYNSLDFKLENGQLETDPKHR